MKALSLIGLEVLRLATAAENTEIEDLSTYTGHFLGETEQVLQELTTPKKIFERINDLYECANHPKTRMAAIERGVRKGSRRATPVLIFSFGGETDLKANGEETKVLKIVVVDLRGEGARKPRHIRNFFFSADGKQVFNNQGIPLTQEEVDDLDDIFNAIEANCKEQN